MISSSKDSIQEVVNSLSPIEKAILYECGKMCISVNKNVNEDTIKKKLPDKYHKDFSKAIKNLLSKGILVRYRHKNYGVSKEWRVIIAYIVEERHKDRYGDLRILMLLK